MVQILPKCEICGGAILPSGHPAELSCINCGRDPGQVVQRGGIPDPPMTSKVYKKLAGQCGDCGARVSLGSQRCRQCYGRYSAKTRNNTTPWRRGNDIVLNPLDHPYDPTKRAS